MNGSRRARIARGSGVHVSEVNQLLERFGEAQKMMRQLRRGGGIPGMPGMGGGKKRVAPPRKKGKSGNPAKRAEQEKAMADKQAAARAAATESLISGDGSAFGAGALGGGGAAPNLPAGLDPSKLPKGLDKFLK